MAQPQKKAPIKKKATISDLKSKMGFGVTVEKGSIQGASNADKPMDWILMPKAFHSVLSLLPLLSESIFSPLRVQSRNGLS